MDFRVNRRGFLRRSAAVGTVVGLPIASMTADHVGATQLQPAGVDLRWLGVNGWEISFDGKRVLIDPWLTRFPAVGPEGAFDRTTPLTVDHALVDDHVTGVDVVLVTHGHFDHIADVPYVMSKFPGARVVGTETHAHLLTAMGVDERQVIWARGGELLEFDGFTVEVIPSLHSLDEDHRYLFPGTANAQPEPPRTIGDLIEGGTLAYQVSIGERLRVLNTGTANLIERALTGLRPDVALLSYTRSPGTHRYLGRALELLGRPAFVLPSHHDDLETPLADGPTVDADLLGDFAAVVAAVSPESQVLHPRHLRPISF